MSHLHFSPDCTIEVGNEVVDTLILDFSGMTLNKLLALRQLGEGKSAKECTSWDVASVALRGGLLRHLDRASNPRIYIAAFMLVIQVDTDPKELIHTVIDFLGREGVRAKDLSGPQPRHLASA